MWKSFVSLAVLTGLLAACRLAAGEPPPAPRTAGTPDPDGGLRRRAIIGVKLAPVTKEVRERQKLDGDGGVVVEQVFPATSAADGGLQNGDVILAVGGAKVTGVAALAETVAEARAGDVLTLDVVRDGVRAERRVTLKERPRENGDGYDLAYGAVTSRGARLRTIVTRPKAEGRRPAVMLVQGYGCFSIDSAVGPLDNYAWLARDLTRHGYVTLRVDRPGCGDSEGGPCKDVDFDTELEGSRSSRPRPAARLNAPPT